ncbi:MAG: cytidine deaminase [Fidelibacterota bacterium]
MDINFLIEEAISAREKAVAPYSKYQVGAALLTLQGTIIHGCNVESKAYPTTLCAERVAVFSAISQGFNQFKAMALVTEDGAMPCGSCRQIMFEFLGNIPIFVSDLDHNYQTLQISDLLPYPFGK